MSDQQEARGLLERMGDLQPLERIAELEAQLQAAQEREAALREHVQGAIGLFREWGASPEAAHLESILAATQETPTTGKERKRSGMKTHKHIWRTGHTYTGYPARRCRRCGVVQIKDTHWRTYLGYGGLTWDR